MFYIFVTNDQKVFVINETHVRAIRIDNDDCQTLYMDNGQQKKGNLTASTGALSEAMNLALKYHETGGF